MQQLFENTHKPANENWYVCSLVVQVALNKLEQLKKTLCSEPNLEIHGENKKEGKIVVTIESYFQRELANRIEHISKMDGVITALPVYHGLDEQ